MQFTAIEEIAAPQSAVWAHLTDFDRYLGAIRARGGSAEKVSDGPVGPGTVWRGSGEVLGKAREVEVTLVRMDVPERLVVEARAEGIDVTVDVALRAITAGRTRMTVTTEAAARSFAAKVMLKPMTLAKGTLDEKYAARVSGFARRVEKASAA